MSTTERITKPAPSPGSLRIPVLPHREIRSGLLLLLAQTPAAVGIGGYWFWFYGGGVRDNAPAALEAGLGMILVLGACAAAFYAGGVNRRFFDLDVFRFVAQSFTSLGVGLIVIEGVFRLFPRWSPGAVEILAIAAASTALTWAARGVLPHLPERAQPAEGWLVLGGNDLAQALHRDLQSRAGSLGSHVSAGAEQAAIVDGEELRRWGASGRFRRIVITEAACDAEVDLAAALLDCRLRGVEVEEAVDAYERLHHKIWIEAARTEWLILATGFSPSRFYMKLKRAMDAIGAVLLLCAALPIIGIVAAAVRWSSPGPVFFRQERVGLDGRTFVLYKFRSMRTDAEAETGPVWAREHDDRVTPVGRWLRKTRLDEIPQVWNVLRGEMSFIGPRPERPHFVSLLNEHFPYYRLRHYVRPGITGWAQVMYPYGASVADAYEKLQYDLYYARRLSLLLDARIVLKTIYVVLAGRGR